ncbi:glycoside hydrolase family 127 protein [Paenarthrobacter ureafaciens]|uniref:glycoside hydrolase family 127 protein n=1 Tax=Paenarthrobacter ureafaciens TaxID=37931 RepID=UPI001C2C7E9A|nr:beta-L-arabinofuranosidase domain-containing protein [Paenarthrobacter ureafaciens]
MAIAEATRARAVSPSRGQLIPISAQDVRITGGFWAGRQKANAEATLRHCLDWMERLGWIANFDRAAAGAEGPSAGREFADSETYKLLEALAWESSRSADPWVDEAYRTLAARVVAAQQADGYLNTRFGGPGQPARYSDLEWGHELYCAGHMIQAAVARARTLGPDKLVEAAIRLADHICEAFGPEGIQSVCGHPEVEPALVELYRVTGHRRYLDQARLFIERRGRASLSEIEFGAAYFQDDIPVRDATVLRGHAVRALYLAAGAVDLAVESADDALLAAVQRQWENTVGRRTYITGGMGSRHEGESFGDDFELPSDRAYSETCAGVGSLMLSWRLLLADGNPKYADLMERTLYNVIATSPDAAGTAFFYVNPLQRNTPGVEPETDAASLRAASSQRAPWFEVSCCPTNVARTLASLGGYLATVSPEGLQLHQYADSEIETTLPDGQPVHLRVQTEYPNDGLISVTVGADSAEPWVLSLRVPEWARGIAVLVDGDNRSVVYGSTATVTRAFAAGDTIRLELPTSPRVSFPDSRIDALRGTIAIEAGPLVMCAESVDLPVGTELADIRVPGHARPSPSGHDGASINAVYEQTPAAPWPYIPAKTEVTRNGADLNLVPYYRWAERGPSTMRVWLPLAEAEWRKRGTDE